MHTKTRAALLALALRALPVGDAAAKHTGIAFAVQSYATVTQPAALLFGPGRALGTDPQLHLLAATVRREPLVRFGLAGAAIFLVHAWFVAPAASQQADISSAILAEARAQIRSELGRAPTLAETKVLQAQLVDDEVLYREALALGLDRGDGVIRRRLIQKMHFLAADLGPGAEPTHKELADYLGSHRDKYLTPELFTFSHLFFSRQLRGDHAAQVSAKAALHTLTAAKINPKSDAFVPGETFKLRSAAQLEGIFGPSFASALRGLPLGTCSGPVASSFGFHIIKLDELRPPSVPPLAAVRQEVRAALLESRRYDARVEMVRRLRSKYHVAGEPQQRALLPPSFSSEEQE